jgi:hypothetical protein
MLFTIPFLFFFISSASAVNLAWEEIQLTEAEPEDYPAIRFGDLDNPSPLRGCKYTPDDDEWPSADEWAKLNETLEGALLKPQPLAIVCYEGPQYDAAACSQLQRTWTSMRLQ